MTKSILKRQHEDMIPQGEISVLLMNGTEDPLVPYEGGPIVVALSQKIREAGKGQTRGSVISTDETVAYWLQHNNLTGEPATGEIEDEDRKDGATAVVQTWSNGRLSVVLYRIEQGGHTYPGGSQYLPQSMIGNTCLDFDATEVIWDFFSQHSK